MKTILKYLAALALPFFTASAQMSIVSNRTASDTARCCEMKADSASGGLSASNLAPAIVMQNFRPADQRGVNMFEAPKDAGVPFTGVRLAWGASFRQQFQGLEHTNSATPVMAGTVNQNQLMDIGRGFNLASANLNMNLQVADGIRVSLSSYLSSRHHQETWVKDGYALIDKSPIDHPLLNKVMQYTTLKLGHFEINYGDQHFRRSDNGNGMHNPFVGNLIIDAFTTEVGGEAYLRANGFLAMAGLTSGTINGGVTTPQARSNAYLGKVGYDKQVTRDLRARLTGSYYKNDKSPSNTLLTGDRAGSPYYFVMENTAASTTAQAWSGAIRPGFNNTVRAYAINPFVKYQGLELFGTAEHLKGKSLNEPTWRDWKQYAGEVVYRFFGEDVYAGVRSNTAKGSLPGIANDVSVDRNAFTAGWYVTPLLLMKGEFMQQRYYRFPATDIRRGGKIQGFVFEGVVSF